MSMQTEDACRVARERLWATIGTSITHSERDER
jgi:hypothetical protein